jgi:hypothetical protein
LNRVLLPTLGSPTIPALNIPSYLRVTANAMMKVWSLRKK